MTIEEVRQLFTENNNKSRLDIDLINAECITSKNNSFTLDDQGNLTVNSLTTRTGSINDSSGYDIDKVYPIGSIYFNINSTNPSTLFGGTWEQIQGRFILACGSNGDGNNYVSNTIGGNTNHQHQYGMRYHGWNAQTILEGCNDVGVVNYSNTNNVNSSGEGSIIDNSSVIYINSALQASKRQEISYLYQTLGYTQNVSNMPPYLAVYVWKRIA